MSFEKFFLIAMTWLLFWIFVCLAFGRLFEWLEPDEDDGPRHTPKRRGTGR